MKILQINVSNGGSTGNIANSIHRRLLQDGFASLVLYGRGPKGAGLVQNTPERYVNALLSRVSGHVGCFGKKSTDRILEKIETFCPDAVHLHNLHGYYADVFRLLEYLKVHKIKTVVTLHDEFLFTGRCTFSGECEKWRINSVDPANGTVPAGGCGSCPRLNEYPAALLDKSDALWARKKQAFFGFENLTVVSPSRWLADRAKASFLQEYPVFVIPNGIETDVFYPGKSTVRDVYKIKEERVVLAAAQDIMNGRKGGGFVLKLAKEMPKTRFVIVGAEKDVPCPPNVTLVTKRLSTEEMANFYRGADVFLITSREDNFPTVCLEAAACGTPVAGFASGGAPETVSQNTSRFVPFGDITALKAAVKELFLLDSKEQNAKLFTNTAEEMYQNYKKVYFGKFES